MNHTPLLQSFADNASNESLWNLHQRNLFKDSDNMENILKLVNILGGIDRVLSDYLNDTNNLKLTQEQLNQIKQLLTKQKNSQQRQRAITNSSIKMNNNYFYYEFDISDTYLHSLFSEQTAQKMLNSMHNKFIQIMIVIAFVIWFAIWIIFGIGWIYVIYTIFACLFFGVPYFIIWILSSNRLTLGLVIKSFEPWFKAVYSWMYGSLATIYYYKLNVSNQDDSYFVLSFLASAILINIFMIPLITICLSLFDAVKMKKGWKIILPIIPALIATYFSIFYQFLVSKEDDYIIHLTSNSSLSFLSQMAGKLRILAIFWWKQAFLSCIRDSRAVSIKYTPYIKWNNKLSNTYSIKYHSRRNKKNHEIGMIQVI